VPSIVRVTEYESSIIAKACQKGELSGDNGLMGMVSTYGGIISMDDPSVDDFISGTAVSLTHVSTHSVPSVV